ncbi:uncharacterized protein L199_003524 [Kwoniella botswanensis]|uniref:uncharacterized protein n=1 Tax=Kwoniella botswanensis TaxID=1268659 RepID=UPI00315D5490
MKTTHLVYLTTLTVFFNTINVLAEGTFGGCFTQQPYGDYSQETSDPEVCASSCSTTYSDIAYGEYCFCTASYPTHGYRVNGDFSTCISEGNSALYIDSTTFDFDHCSTAFITSFNDQDSTQYSTVTGVVGCLNQCSTSRYAVFSYDNTKGSYVCACGDDISEDTPETCGSDSALIYSHPAGAAASGLARRSAREALRRSRQAALIQTCPKGLTACVIPGLEGTDAWECVDTQNDLESCGGCLHGSYKNSTTAVGQSCQNQKGIKLGGTTCQAGKCVNYGCASAYRLVDGDCIAI